MWSGFGLEDSTVQVAYHHLRSIGESFLFASRGRVRDIVGVRPGDLVGDRQVPREDAVILEGLRRRGGWGGRDGWG